MGFNEGIWLLGILHKNDLIVALTDLFQQILAQRFGCHLSKVLFYVVSDMWKVGNEARAINPICKLGSSLIAYD